MVWSNIDRKSKRGRDGEIHGTENVIVESEIFLRKRNECLKFPENIWEKDHRALYALYCSLSVFYFWLFLTWLLFCFLFFYLLYLIPFPSQYFIVMDFRISHLLMHRLDVEWNEKKIKLMSRGGGSKQFMSLSLLQRHSFVFFFLSILHSWSF